MTLMLGTACDILQCLCLPYQPVFPLTHLTCMRCGLSLEKQLASEFPWEAGAYRADCRETTGLAT